VTGRIPCWTITNLQTQVLILSRRACDRTVCMKVPTSAVVQHLRDLLADLMTPKDWIATFVAVVALATSIWSARESRTFNRLAARPHFVIAEMFSPSSPRLGLVVANLGPGIGIVDEFNLSLDGTRLAGDWATQWEQFRKATGAETWTNRGGFETSEALAASPLGEILIIVDETKFSQKNPDQWAQQSERLKAVVKHLTVDIRYHSVFGERFEIEKQGLQPARFRRRNWFGRFVAWYP
jgi:hypothetical protein